MAGAEETRFTTGPASLGCTKDIRQSAATAGGLKPQGNVPPGRALRRSADNHALCRTRAVPCSPQRTSRRLQPALCKWGPELAEGQVLGLTPGLREHASQRTRSRLRSESPSARGLATWGGGGGCARGTWELLAGDGTLTKAVTRAATVTTLDP